MENELPQPQEDLALGFFTWNEAPTRSSTKSISAPDSRSSEVSSIDFYPVALEQMVIGLDRVIERKTVLEARAAAARDAKPQHQASIAFLGDQAGDALDGAIGQADLAFRHGRHVVHGLNRCELDSRR
jgi:hypothetical protein